VTELVDPEHEMVRRAVEGDVWDTVMVAFHMIHQNARAKVFPLTMANRIGTLLMFVVLNIFSNPSASPQHCASEPRAVNCRAGLPTRRTRSVF
jgi:hypothetical protein